MTTPTFEGLLASARFFSDRALRDYTNGDHRSVLMDAGTFVEHISKAFLVEENPAYLVELRSGGFDHLLHLTGRGNRAARPDPVRTIGANEAVARVRKLLEIHTPSPISIRSFRSETASCMPARSTRPAPASC